MKKGKLSLQAIIIIFVCIVAVLSLGITDLIISNRITSSVEETEKEKALNAAKMVALSLQLKDWRGTSLFRPSLERERILLYIPYKVEDV